MVPHWRGDNNSRVGAVVNLPEADAPFPSRRLAAALMIRHFRRYFVIIIIVVNFHHSLMVCL